MNTQSLRVISQIRKMNQSDLAELARVSRQAVSQWLKEENVDVGSTHLRDLAQGLNVRSDDLLFPIPLLGDKDRVRRLETSLLWDRLYPTLLDFSLALARREPPALARLVEVEGLYGAAQVVGDQAAWGRFHEYKNRIRPARRQQLESLWQIHRNLV